MRELTREEIDQFWENAYYQVNGIEHQVIFTWIMVLGLLAPVSAFGFLPSQVLAWGFFAIITLTFFHYGLWIWRKSEKGNYPARFAIIRNLIISTHVSSIFWLFFLFLTFGSLISENGSNLLLIAVITVSAHILTIFLVLAFFDGGRTITSKGIRFFESRWAGAYGFLIVFLALSTSQLTSFETAGKISIFLFSGAALFIFIVPSGRAYLIWALLRIGLDNSPFQTSLKHIKKQLKEMRKAREQGPIRTPVFCEGCNAQGEIGVDDAQGNYYVICEVCGTETAEVWCDEGVGGQFVRNIQEHPLEYDCEICKKTHKLPQDFYEKPVMLELIEEPRNKRK